MNVADRIARHLSDERLCVLRLLSRLAESNSVGLYLVGGSVRDIMLGRAPADLDVMGARGAEALVAALTREPNVTVEKRSRFGTWHILARGVDVDVSTARRETYDRPGALPTVAPGDAMDDAARRDFSVNAMSVSLMSASWGETLDPLGGARDLARRVIRALHDRSFEDDPTRILRAIRYARSLDFTIEPHTEALLRRDVRHLGAVSGARIRNELLRSLREARAAEMIHDAERMGVLASIHPALRYDPAMRALDGRAAACEEDGADRVETLLALLTGAASASEADSLVERLALNAEQARVVRDAAAVRALRTPLTDDGVTASRASRILRGRHPASVRACSLLWNDDRAGHWLDAYLATLRHVRPLLDGERLMRLGVPHGPAVGRALEALTDARLDGRVATLKDEETLARQFAAEESSGRAERPDTR